MMDIVYGLTDMLYDMDNPLKNFKKNMYESIFTDYQKKFSKTIHTLETTLQESDSTPDLIEEICSTFVKQVDQSLTSIPKKRELKNKLMDYNLMLVAYICPVLLKMETSYGRDFANVLVAKWNGNFPETNLNVASFEEINEGFKKRYCYITTAVCESLGKPDDCYELTLLRNYRDDYLLKQPKGNELIQCYYDIAPTIVKHINKEKNAHEIYLDIWKQYLSPCIEYIEHGENEPCKELYTEMIHHLQDRYFICNTF